MVRSQFSVYKEKDKRITRFYNDTVMEVAVCHFWYTGQSKAGFPCVAISGNVLKLNRKELQ